MGIPISFANESEYILEFMRAKKTNIDNRIPLRLDTTRLRESTVSIDYDYTTRTGERSFYQLTDVFMMMGGHYAFFLPIFFVITPFFVLYFLYKLAKHIQREYMENHRLITVNFLHALM